jgi:hypothetical protein
MVYLSDEEFADLRRVSAETGASQSELIRRGLRTVLRDGPEVDGDLEGGAEARPGRRPMRWTSFGRH